MREGKSLKSAEYDTTKTICMITNSKYVKSDSRQGVGTVHASSNFAASHHYESLITCVPQDWLPAGFTGPGSD